MTDEERYKSLLLRKQKIVAARDDLITFAEYIHPHPDFPNDPTMSGYQAKKHHRVIAAALEQVARGLIPRLIITVPPRHGKTELATKSFIPWYLGQFPTHHIIASTYNDKFSWDFGRKVRETLRDPLYRHVFPEVQIKAGAASVDRVELESGGIGFFVGRGGTVTGRGGMGLIIDDPIKDREEADSKTIREKLWTWYTQTMSSRLMTKAAWIILIQTRWHEDDLIGRITDPLNTFYNAKEAAKWSMIDLPALAEDRDLLGRKPGEALWPERFDVDFLQAQKRTDPRGFMALYQGRPAPEDGIVYRAEMLKEYHNPSARPPIDKLRMYCASDHAVSTAQGRDKTCLLPFGVDQDDNIWIMDDVVWERITTDVAVERMCNLILKYKPIQWFGEKGHISKSIGPFLRKRMNERKAWTSMDEITPVGDKLTRAQSVIGRTSMGKIFFPAYAHWWPEARSEILKFPAAAHDDFVDALSMMGMGLLKQMRPRSATEKKPEIKFGTGAWIGQMRKEEKRDRNAAALKGW